MRDGLTSQSSSCVPGGSQSSQDQQGAVATLFPDAEPNGLRVRSRGLALSDLSCYQGRGLPC